MHQHIHNREYHHSGAGADGALRAEIGGGWAY
jgi:hypothetical protein